jgi:Ca2+-binding RTX toxin-like protein
MQRLILLLSLMAVTLVVTSGVALAVARSGGPGDDTLRGTNGPDALSGNGGDDVLLGLRGRDALDGGPGRDAVLGGNEFGPLEGDRSLDGGDGGDFVGSGLGSDAMAGGPGRDFLLDAEFEVGHQDVISAGSDDDAIDAIQRPAARDVIDCGSGFDGVLVDSKDITSGCERIFTSVNRFYGRFLENSNYNYFEPLNRL